VFIQGFFEELNDETGVAVRLKQRQDAFLHSCLSFSVDFVGLDKVSVT
jgi:hypothetical protein